MKKCPHCNRIYDDSQSFCLEDGASLSLYATTDSRETIAIPRRKSRLPLFFGGLLLLTALGALTGGWLLLGSKAGDAGQNNQQQAAVNVQTPVSMRTPPPTLETPPPLPPSLSPPEASPEANSNVSTNSTSANSAIEPESSVSPKPPDESNPAKPLPVIMKTEDHQVLFALHECRKSGSSITCFFSLTNKGQDRRFRFSRYESKLFDELGNGYKGSDAQVANQTGGRPEIDFISSVTTKAQMTFENIEPNAAKITLLDLSFSIERDFGLSVKFRNVPLTVSKSLFGNSEKVSRSS
jgi:hypothetical protein